MNIAICDDEINALKQISDVVKAVFNEMELKYSINEYTDADELQASKISYDIIFLDIEFKNSKYNGVLAAQMIKRKAPDCIIIFTTNHEEYIDEVIEKYAFRYWSKPIDEYRLRKSVKSILERMETITVEVQETKQQLELSTRNIIYITPKDKHCKIVTIQGEYITTESFKEIKSKFVARDFCDCHGSYCVNLNFVEKYTKLEVCLRHQTKVYKVHMSRRRYKNFKEQMFIVGGEKV